MASRDVHPPAAFLSYARFNDKQDDDHITSIRTKLAGEVQTVTGKAFEIFQDRFAIRTGEEWKTRIEESIDSATLLIAVLTPSFFNSDYCRNETKQFLDREAKLGRRDLIVPIYYVPVEAMDGDEADGDELVVVMRARQRFDALDMRFLEMDSSAMRKAVNQLALQIKSALKRFPAAVTGPAPVVPPPADPGSTPAAPAEQIVQTSRRDSQATATSEPRTLIVDGLRGPYRKVGDAIAAATSVDRITVRPGTYDEGLVVDKPLEILGDGNAEEIIVQSDRTNALAFRAALGRIANITFRQLGGGDFFAVDISQGRLTLERCRIEGASLAGIAIHGAEAEAIVRNNVVRKCQQSGIAMFDHAKGTLEENDIADNNMFGVLVREGASPVLRNNRIHDNEHGGVFVDGAPGRLEDNSIFNNRAEGVLVANDAKPELVRNQVSGNTKAGIYLYDRGAGTIRDNKIFDNLNSGIAIRTEANPIIQHNTITGNNGKGVWCNDGAAGVVENNDLRGNKFDAFWMSPDSKTRYVGNQE